MQTWHPILLSILLTALTSCSTVGPKVCSYAPKPIKSLAEKPTEHIHASLQKTISQYFKSGSTNNLDIYNQEAAALLHQSYCKTKNLKLLTPKTGAWTKTLPKGAISQNEFDAIFPSSLVNITPVLTDHFQGSGLGIPLVGWIDNISSKPKPPTFMAPRGRAIPLTAVLNYINGQPTWILYPSKDTRSIKVGNTTFDLAADYTAANAIFWSRSTLRKNILTGFFLPDRITTGTGLYLDQPYDHKKIPILCVHGLKSSPDAFRFMANQLRSIKDIRDNYQFIYFYYPTGKPWTETGRRFRADVRQMQTYANNNGGAKTFNKMIVLAHSMGGLITRTSISSNPQELFNALYHRPIKSIKGTEANRQLVRDSLHFKPLTAPKRIVFMATPHRGSALADMKAVNLLSLLINLPANTTLDLLNILQKNGSQLLQGNGDGIRIPTSLSELSPNDPFIKAVPKLKFPSYIKVHSIIGAHKGNKKSDGVVPYWSSHLPSEQTESELIINSNHSVPYRNPAIKEVARILKLHLKQNLPLSTDPQSPQP